MHPLLGKLKPTVQGSCDPRFRAVADVFEQSFAGDDENAEVGSSCAVIVDGKRVVDLWGGFADIQTASPWQQDNAHPAVGPSTRVCALRSP